MEEPEELEGIAAADARLGASFPLPSAPLPLARWVQVRALGDGAQVEWNLDDTRPGTPGRLALYAGPSAPPGQLPPGTPCTATPEGWSVGRAPLTQAQPSLRPVVQVDWVHAGLHLRLTAQGPWALDDVLKLVRSVR